MANTHFSRRTVLRGLVATGCAMCLPRLGLSEGGKLSQVQAQYQDQPKGEQACANCMHFAPPSSCKVVDGTISPNAWCKLWVTKK